MKTFILPLFALLSLSAQATPLEYQCRCVDTGSECDGMERMNVELAKDQGTFTLGSEDWEMNDEFSAEINSKYKPRSSENETYTQYKITGGGGGYGYDARKSSFLVESALMKGRKTGFAKFQSYSKESGFYSWLFKCAKR